MIAFLSTAAALALSLVLAVRLRQARAETERWRRAALTAPQAVADEVDRLLRERDHARRLYHHAVDYTTGFRPDPPPVVTELRRIAGQEPA